MKDYRPSEWRATLQKMQFILIALSFSNFINYQQLENRGICGISRCRQKSSGGGCAAYDEKHKRNAYKFLWDSACNPPRERGEGAGRRHTWKLKLKEEKRPRVGLRRREPRMKYKSVREGSHGGR